MLVKAHKHSENQTDVVLRRVYACLAGIAAGVLAALLGPVLFPFLCDVSIGARKIVESTKKVGFIIMK